MNPLTQREPNAFATDLVTDHKARQEVETRIEDAKSLLLFLDFDGTLAPIVAEPMMAVLPAPTREVLMELSTDSEITIAIVSGRSLEDVRGRVAIPSLIYAGNHGLEIDGSGLCFEHRRAAELKVVIREITERLAAHAASLEGVEIESKSLTSSIHYRRAARAAQIHLEAVLRDLIAQNDPRIEVRAGKMVHEIRPRVDWDKGRAVAWIRDRLGRLEALPIVVGDDMTDENAFRAFDDAITICVDPRRRTAAQYAVDSPEQVTVLLKWIARSRDERRPRRARASSNM